MNQPPADRVGEPESGSPTHLADVAIGGFSGLFLLVLMLVTVVDVIGRYLLNAPLRGSYELSAILMAAIVYSGLPVVSGRDAHVSVDLLDHVIWSRAVPLQRGLIHLVSALFFALIAWRLWVLAGEALRFGDVTEYLRLSRAPISYFGAVLSASAGAIHAFKAVQAAAALRGGRGGKR